MKLNEILEEIDECDNCGKPTTKKKYASKDGLFLFCGKCKVTEEKYII